MIRWIVAFAHLLALGIGLGAVWVRARALRGPLDDRGVRSVLVADTWWGIAAFLWISTGLVRLFAGLEKGTPYYLQNHFFWGKMGLLVLLLLLEIAPMVALIGWRVRMGRGQPIDTSRAGRFARISEIEAGIVVLMVLFATAMARGLGAGAP